jgi:hypothetical protein
MNIQLGNLDLKDVVEAEYINQIQNFLDSNGFKKESVCNNIQNEEGNYHIFDMPRLFVICGENKMQEFIKFLQENDFVQKAFIGRLGLSYETKK